MWRRNVISALSALKLDVSGDDPFAVPVKKGGKAVATLRVITRQSIKDPAEIRALAKWRNQSQQWFPTQFNVTIAGTKKWAREQLIQKEDRILFMIEDLRGRRLGHVGLNRFDFDKKSCEIDNIIRGEAGIPGLMTAAISSMCSWGKRKLGIKTYFLQCLGHNTKAIALYRRCGFRRTGSLEHGMIRMKKI